jgi:hypothetical protein
MSDTENIEQNDDLNDDELEGVSGGFALLPGMKAPFDGHWPKALGVCE